MRVAMIGPDLEAQGGIATLARTFIEAKAMEGVEIRYFPSVGEGSKLRKVAQMAKGQAAFLKGVLGDWKPDLVHIHVADGVSFYRKLVYFNQARAMGLPVILHNNFAFLEDLVAKSPVHESLVRRAYSEATQVHVVSHDMANNIREWTDGQANIRVLFNPVPADGIPYPGPRGPKESPVILFMGRVGERKGIFDLIRAMPEISARVPKVRLKVGGDGELVRLNQEIATNNLEPHVDVLGWISGEDRLAAYADADLYCLPSYAEGLPVSVLEAMAAGLPVVSTTADGIPDAVMDGETGLLFEAGDIGALAEKVVTLLQDPERRDAMGTAGRKRVLEVFDGEILAGTLRGYWEECLS
ncbi:MAG: glycosyltransferase family 4 protein [Myxococcota bacterium]|nr:glycosyltransferase family 4 protein [Myxococcota bacterium]